MKSVPTVKLSHDMRYDEIKNIFSNFRPYMNQEIRISVLTLKALEML
jgi:hypothetical protein